jgi:hypothetical protein
MERGSGGGERWERGREGIRGARCERDRRRAEAHMLSGDTAPYLDSRVPTAGPGHREDDDWVGASAVRCFCCFHWPLGYLYKFVGFLGPV